MADPKAIFEESDATDENNRMLISQPACLKCGQIQRMMKCCTRCHAAFYCSRDCFVHHWPIHKGTCKPQKKFEEDTATTQNEIDSAGGKKIVYKVLQRGKEESTRSHSQTIDFQKAADALSSQQRKEEEERKSRAEQSGSGVNVVLRYDKKKHRFKVSDAWDGPTVFARIASFLSCLSHHMRLIHKGRQVGPDSVRGVVCPGAVFQVLAERMEDAEGLEPRDIEVMMQQMGLERNVAVKALKSAKGDLIDAMTSVGNK